ncbi:MAG: hypothetical protein JNJ60_17700, partial [Rhodocyclaceae bacterium]|nr:hypothetical protein [Rhodocyclaceae bacterium]
MECNDSGSVLVVGIGASAGGLHSLRPLLQALEPGRPIAYIVAHHQGAGADTQMTALLAQGCRLTVELATDGAPLCAGHVYVTPPGFDVIVGGDTLALLAPAADSLIAPSVNRLFRSLGELGARAVGIVLSGAGRDGAEGAAVMRRGGGVVIAQLPEQALQRGMPDALIAAGAADHVGSVEQIAAWLNDELNRLPLAPRASAQVHDASFADLLDMVTRASGIDLQRYKQSTLRRQATRRYLGLGLHTVPEYLDYVRREPEELLRLQQAFLISVSAFFRDGAAFAACEAALRHLLARKPDGVPLRIWVPGCASGEEAYSLAMLVAEIQGPELDPALLRIFATDIDPEGLDQARAGLYSASEVVALGSERCARFMQQEGKLWRVAPRLRECCVFARHDVIAHPPFINLDMVSCRNLLIYFTPTQQTELLRTFQYALRPDGLLLLGRSESVGVNSSGFAAVDSSNKLYRRRNLAGGQADRAFRQTPLINVSAPAMEKPAGMTQRKQLLSAALTAIAAHGPPAVLVDTKFEPLHFFANSHRYFALPEGSADFTIHV